jgi:hypothetical protein
MTNKLIDFGKNAFLVGDLCLEGLLEGAVIGTWTDPFTLFEAGSIIRKSVKTDRGSSLAKVYSACFYAGESLGIATLVVGIGYLSRF